MHQVTSPSVLKLWEHGFLQVTLCYRFCSSGMGTQECVYVKPYWSTGKLPGQSSLSAEPCTRISTTSQKMLEGREAVLKSIIWDGNPLFMLLQYDYDIADKQLFQWLQPRFASGQFELCIGWATLLPVFLCTSDRSPYYCHPAAKILLDKAMLIFLRQSCAQAL